MTRWLVTLFLALGSASAAEPTPPPHSDVAILWQGDPIAIELPLNDERRIDFPEPIADLDVPATLEARSRIVLTPEGQLHWQASEAFEPARVLATSITGTLYLMDVSASPKGTQPQRIRIIDPLLLSGEGRARAAKITDQEALNHAAEALIPDFLKSESTTPSGQPDTVAMARYALSHYSGPGRLIPSLEAVQIPLRDMDPRALLRVQAAFLAVQPLAQWQVGERYVTALAVYNQSAQSVDFDPPGLRGELLFAAALQPRLLPAGSGHNGTVWALVTKKPFNQAVRAP